MRLAGKARLAALLTAAVLCLAAAGLGEQIGAYGGSGEDILLEAVACGDGLFAAGRTASADRDLSMRTREGETGWAVRIGAQGEILWSFCSAHVGLQTMTSPLALEDGSFSVVLTNAAGAQGEWIILDGNGKLKSRMEVPDALCAHGGVIARMIPVEAENGCALAVVYAHPDGETCCHARFDPDGRKRAGETFACGAEAAAGRGSGGMLVLADAREGALRMTRAGADGSAAQAELQTDFAVGRVHEVLVAEDESALVCGGAYAQDGESVGFLMRLSSEGELLIGKTFPEYDSMTHLTATDTGYALLGMAENAAEIVFIDEDGASLGKAQAPAATLDLAQTPGGAAALSHLSGRGQRQAVVTRIAQPEASQDEQTKEDAQLEALAQEMLLAQQTLQPAQTPAVQAEDDRLSAGEGYLRCSPDGFGVLVTFVGADGRDVFTTRTPIHTAADMLEWRCAVRCGGDVLLGGRYLTGEGEAMRQEAVVALLTGDGVLRRIETLSGAGAVCAMELTDGGVLLHMAADSLPSLTPDKTLLYVP